MAVDKLRLTNIKATRQTFARILKAYNDDEMELEKYKALIYGLSGFIQWFKLESELDIEKRLEAIEQALEAR